MSLPVSHGAQLLLLLGVTAAPIAIVLCRARAPFSKWLRAPVAAALAVFVGAILWTQLRQRIVGLAVPGMSATLIRVAGLLFFAALGAIAGRLLAGRYPAVVHKRGTRIVDTGSARAWARRANGRLTVAGVALDRLDETKHLKVIGTTGTGKSTAIRELLAGALRRGDRAIVADPDGGYLGRFYDARAGDSILNPFDGRSSRWDAFGEINDAYDAEQLARSLIPDHGGDERSWRNYARTYLTSILRQLWELGEREPAVRSVAELYRVAALAATGELAQLLDGTAARPYLEEGNERMFGSIRSVAVTYLAALEHLGRSPGAPLSIRRWVRGQDGASGRPGRVLFLPYSANQIPALRSMISAWLRLAIFETMNGPEQGPGDTRRLWFLVDELDALGAIDGLKDALARLRKFGGCCVLGFQSIAQVSSTYGAGDAHTIVENCGNTLILRCSASEQGGTAQFASRLIGQREVVRPYRTTSRRSGELRGSHSTGEQHVTEPAVLPSEIEQLADLRGYLKLASAIAWRRVGLRPG